MTRILLSDLQIKSHIPRNRRIMDLNNDKNEQNDSRSPVKPFAMLLALLLFIGMLIYFTKTQDTGTGGGASGKGTDTGTGAGTGQGGGAGNGNSADGVNKESNGSGGNKDSTDKKGGDSPSESNTKTNGGAGENSNGNKGSGNNPKEGAENSSDTSPSKNNSSGTTEVPTGNFTVDDKIIWDKATEFIRRRAVLPEKVKMPELGVAGTSIKKASDSTFAVNGYFDAPNIKGAIKRSTFKCIIFLSPHGFIVLPNQYTID
jgi:hypothetical protein